MSAAAGQGVAMVAGAAADAQSATAGEALLDTRSPHAAEAPRDVRSVTVAGMLADAQRLPAFADDASSEAASRATSTAPAPADSDATHHAGNAHRTHDTPAPLQLRIDRLVIDGLPRLAGGERALRAALLQELQHLLTAQPPALTQGGALARLPALELALPAGADAAGVGRALARALHRSLGA